MNAFCIYNMEFSDQVGKETSASRLYLHHLTWPLFHSNPGALFHLDFPSQYKLYFSEIKGATEGPGKIIGTAFWPL